MIITTYNKEIFTVPDENILYFDAQTHTFIKNGKTKNYINRMKLKIKSDKNIMCNDTEDKSVQCEDMGFAERISKYDDIKTIEFNNCVYMLSWTDNPRKYGENKEQSTFVKGDTVHITLGTSRCVQKTKGEFMKNFYLIVGLMGSGKDTVVSEIMRRKAIKFLRSYTTRKKRFENENTHTFISKYEFGKLKNKIAVSCINNVWYATTEDQIDDFDIGIFDNDGARQVLSNYGGNKNIKIIYIDVPYDVRKNRMLARGDSIEEVTGKLEYDNSVDEFFKNRADIVVNNNQDIEIAVKEVVEFIALNEVLGTNT